MTISTLIIGGTPLQFGGGILVLNTSGVSAPAILTSSLPIATNGTAYSYSMSGTGGTTPYTWAITSGSLPTGLSFSSAGAFSGTPTATVTASLTIRLTDATSQTASGTFSLQVNAANTVVITTTSLPTGVNGNAYSTTTLTATGGTSPYTWAITSGSLPTGMTFSSAGVLSGTPTVTQTVSLTIQATDSASHTGSATFTLTINASSSTLTITTTSLASGAHGTAYTSSLAATGGTSPYTWSLVSGTLPTGLTLSSGGVLSGTPSVPTAAGVYDGTVKISNGKLVNSTGQILQLRGANMSGLQYVAIQGWSPSDPWGGNQGPYWSVYQTWKPNVVRLPLNEASWLGDTVANTASQALAWTAAPVSGSTGGSFTGTAWALASGTYPINFNPTNVGYVDQYAVGTFTNGSNAVTWPSISFTPSGGTSANAVIWGATRSADPGSNYRAAVITAVRNAQAINCYVILDLHLTTPSVTIGGVTHPIAQTNGNGQSPFASDRSAAFWSSIASVFGTQATPQTGINNNGIIFELFNEPFCNSNSYICNTATGGTGTAITDKDVLLLNGGYSSNVINLSQGGSNYVLPLWWQVAGYQPMLNAIRATGATNICIINGNAYTGQTRYYSKYLPTDSLNQLALGWHCYPNATTYANEVAGNTWPSDGITAPDTPNANAYNDVLAALAAGIPVISTEDGSWGGSSCTSGSPHLTANQAWHDAHGVSWIGWQHNNPVNSGTTSEQFYLNAWTDNTYTTFSPALGCGSVTYAWMSGHTTNGTQTLTIRATDTAANQATVALPLTIS